MLSTARFWSNLDDILVAIFPSLNRTSDFSDISLSFRRASFKELFNARQTLSKVTTCHTTGVEGLKCQLRTRLTDGLRGDNTDRLSRVDNFTRRHVDTVAL